MSQENTSATPSLVCDDGVTATGSSTDNTVWLDKICTELVYHNLAFLAKYKTSQNFNRYNYLMHSGFALLMALYYGHDSPCIEIIFKCDYERLPCCPGKTRRQDDHEPECNVKSEIKTCSDRTGALD